MDFFAVFGNPVWHSKSPQIFNSFFTQKNIDARYFRILPASVKNIPVIIKYLNLKGVNITSPFKTEIIKILDEISLVAEKVNAVNTIKLTKNKLIGYNTDVYGVGNIIKKYSFKTALVLGAGGAANAAIFALKQNNIAITVLNRTKEKVKILSEKYNCKFDDLKNINKYRKTFDVIVNTISKNIKIIDDDFFVSNQVFIDANYKNSVYANFSENKNIEYINGNEWLLNQAIPAFTIFTDKSVFIDNFKIHEIKYNKILLSGEFGNEISKKLNNPIFINEKNKYNADKTFVVRFIDLNNHAKINLKNTDLLIDVTDKSSIEIINILNSIII